MEIPESIKDRVKRGTARGAWMRLCRCGRWVTYANPHQANRDYRKHYAIKAALKDIGCNSCNPERHAFKGKVPWGSGSDSKYDNTTSGLSFPLPQSFFTASFQWFSGSCSACSTPFNKKYPIDWHPLFVCKCGEKVKVL